MFKVGDLGPRCGMMPTSRWFLNTRVRPSQPWIIRISVGEGGYQNGAHNFVLRNSQGGLVLLMADLPSAQSTAASMAPQSVH